MDDLRLTLDPVPYQPGQPDLVPYPVPLQGLRVAHLYLPADRTRGDVTRLIAMLTALKVAPDEPLPRQRD
jgi:hypothetical protein